MNLIATWDVTKKRINVYTVYFDEFSSLLNRKNLWARKEKLSQKS